MTAQIETSPQETPGYEHHRDGAAADRPIVEAPTRSILQILASLDMLRDTLSRLGQRINDKGCEQDPRPVVDGYEGDALGLHYCVDRNIPQLPGSWAILRYSDLLHEVNASISNHVGNSETTDFDPTMVRYLADFHQTLNTSDKQSPVDGLLLMADGFEWWGNENTPWVAGIEESQKHFDIVAKHPNTSMPPGVRPNIRMCIGNILFPIGTEKPKEPEQYLS